MTFKNIYCPIIHIVVTIKQFPHDSERSFRENEISGMRSPEWMPAEKAAIRYRLGFGAGLPIRTANAVRDERRHRDSVRNRAICAAEYYRPEARTAGLPLPKSQWRASTRQCRFRACGHDVH